jgi:hypothetical protein
VTSILIGFMVGASLSSSHDPAAPFGYGDDEAGKGLWLELGVTLEARGDGEEYGVTGIGVGLLVELPS